MNRAFLAGVLLALASGVWAQVDPSRVVATINGTEIKGAEYYRRMEFLPGVGKNLGDGFAEFPPGFLTLEQLITEKLVFQLAAKKGVTPTDAEIQDELKYRLSKNPRLLDDWLASGRTRADLEYDVKFDLAQFKILTAGITVTDQEVEQYYKGHQDQYTIPKRVQLKVIVVRSQADANAVDKELSAGKAFADVAKAHSADVTATSGGDYGTVPLSYLSETVRNGIANVPAGQATPWFNSSDGSAQFKFLVVKIFPETVQPLDDDVRRQTRQRIMMTKGAVKNDMKKELDAMRASATIDIKDKAFASAYKKYMDAYLKATGAGKG